MALTKVGKEGITGISNSSDATAITIDSSENVGVGTASPSGAKLEIFTGSTAADGLKINRFGSGVYYSTLRMDSHGLAVHVGDGSNISERAAITPNGLTFNGDTAAANALDDYEEGLFTPSFTSDGTNPTVSYSFQRGFYTKVGRTVYFQVQLGTDSVSVGSGSLFISGLPFTSNSSLQSRSGAIGLHYTWSTGIPDAKWVLFANDNKLYLYPGDNVGNTMPTSYLDTGSSKNRIWIQGFYDV